MDGARVLDSSEGITVLVHIDEQYSKNKYAVLKVPYSRHAKMKAEILRASIFDYDDVI